MKKIIWFASACATLALYGASQDTTTQQGGMYYQGQGGGSSTQTFQGSQEGMKNSQGQAVVRKDRFTTPEDERLGQNIRFQLAEIVGAPGSNEIILIIDAGHVKLVGKVPTDAVKSKLSQTLQKTQGVKSVNNQLETTTKTTK